MGLLWGDFLMHFELALEQGTDLKNNHIENRGKFLLYDLLLDLLFLEVTNDFFLKSSVSVTV